MSRSKAIVIVAACCLVGAIVYFFRFSPSARKARHLSQGERYFQSGEYDKAKLEYLNVARADSNNTLAIERLGEIWVNQGAPAHALPFLARVRDLAPANVENRLRLARASLAVGDFRTAWKESLSALEQAADLDAAWIAAADTAATRADLDLLREKLAGATEMAAGQSYAAAVLALRIPDLAAAEKALQECLRKNPKLARAHLRLGDLAFGMRDQEKAIEAIRAAYTVAPPRSYEKLRYPEVLRQIGRAAEARTALQPVLREAADFLPAAILSARIALTDKMPDDGLAALAAVFSRDPANPEARLVQAQLQIAKGDLPAAIENLERLIKAFPRGTLQKLELGRVYALAERPVEAADLLRQALEQNPDYPEAQILLAELDLRNGQTQQAMLSLQRLVAKRPNLSRAQLLLADAYRRLKLFDEAAAIYRKQSEVTPSSAAPLLLLGAVLREQKKFDEAQTAFERAAKLEPNSLPILGQLVGLDLLRQDYGTAQSRITGLDEKTRESAEARIIEARILGAQKRWEPAEQALVQAIQADPESDVAYQMLVALYYENKRVPEAIHRLQEKLARTPDDIASGMLLARLHEEQKDYPAARAAYEAVLAKRPDSMVALNNLAYLLASEFSETARAVELSRKARAIDPGNAAVADTLGWILYGTGDYEGALGLLLESVAKMAEQRSVPGEAQYHLGMAQAAMGHLDSARTALMKAAEDTAGFRGKENISLRLQLIAGKGESAALGLERLEELAKETPGDPLVQLRLGEAHEEAGTASAAAAAYEQALKANPKFALAAARLAHLYSGNLNVPEKASEYAKTARALAPSDRRVAELLGVTAARLGDVQWSYSLLQQTITPSDAGPEALFQFGLVAYRLGKTREARQAMDRASVASPSADLATKIQRQIRILELAEDSAAASQSESEIAEALKVSDTRLAAEMARAAALEAKGDLAGAASIYESVLRREPAFPLAKVALADVKLRLGEWERAHELATAARAMAPDDARTAWVLGETSFRKREYSRAVDFLKEAQRSRSLDPKRLFYLGVAYFELKSRAESTPALREAIAAGLEQPELARAEELLKQLGE